jgi:ribulose-phosphate 3-epimerase
MSKIDFLNRVKVKIAPSILAADFLNLENEIKKIKENNIEILHFDIMDGHFVPNISFGKDFISSLRKSLSIIFDVHLMVYEPEKFIEDFVKAGSDIITFHREVTNTPLRIVKQIKFFKIKAGISLNPLTEISTIMPILDELDIVLIMSVEPGFYGQKFLDWNLKKIEELKNYIVKNNLKTLIEVDGGINEENIKIVEKAGADIVVMGAGFFKNF